MISEQNYSWLDRLLHRLAFSSCAVQLTASDIETILYRREFRAVRIDRPIFVTSLPRAGTTVILEELSRFAGLATHCYRDMPFVLAPLLWEGLSRRFRKPAELTERAHGDGMKVGYDSVEAFEEVLWRAFWPDKFKREDIALWLDDEDAGEFREVFTSHIQRIIAVRSRGASKRTRYISKNNGNIARIGFLKRLFPDSIVLVPFRDPIAQSASLLRQHRRFNQIHRQDRFAKQYMEDIGHLEFGMLHRPIRFASAHGTDGSHHPDTLEYWIRYWIDAFCHVLRQKEAVVLLSYEDLCRGGPAALQIVAERLGIPKEVVQHSGATALTPSKSHATDCIADRAVLDRARSVHRELLACSIL